MYLAELGIILERLPQIESVVRQIDEHVEETGPDSVWEVGRISRSISADPNVIRHVYDELVAFGVMMRVDARRCSCGQYCLRGELVCSVCCDRPIERTVVYVMEPSRAAVARTRISNARMGKRYALVLKGGGVKGAAYVGALSELNLLAEVRFEHFCGTSAGAITAAILAMGHDVHTLEKIVRGIPFSSFLKRGWHPNYNLPPWRLEPVSAKAGLMSSLAMILLVPAHLLAVAWRGFNGGVFSAAPVGRLIKYVHEWRPDSSGRRRLEADKVCQSNFGELRYGLTVVSASTGTSSEHVFALDGDLLDTAVRSSMAIPGLFERVDFGQNVLIDGGVVANYPSRILRKLHPDFNILGMYLYDGNHVNRASDRSAGIVSIVRTLTDVVLGQSERHVVSEEVATTIQIDTHPIGTSDFGVDANDIDLLIAAGRLAVWSFLLSNDHGLALRRALPSRVEYEAERERVDGLRRNAKRRWRWRKRGRLILILLPVFVLLGLTTVGLILSIGWLLSYLR